LWHEKIGPVAWRVAFHGFAAEKRRKLLHRGSWAIGSGVRNDASSQAGEMRKGSRGDGGVGTSLSPIVPAGS
jgi:hypothetical protein